MLRIGWILLPGATKMVGGPGFEPGASRSPNSERSRPGIAETIGFSSKVLTQPAAPSRLEAFFRRFTT